MATAHEQQFSCARAIRRAQVGGYREMNRQRRFCRFLDRWTGYVFLFARFLPQVVFAVACSIVFLVVLGARAMETNGVNVEHGVQVTMRDGTILRADIYRPKKEGKYPTLLERTPYDKTGSAGFGLRASALGYVVIVQDVRGRYTSDGEWYPFKHESSDGYDTIEWAAALPYSDGRVGMFGGSYVGATQMLAAISHPPHLAGICPIVTASNYHDGWTYQGGAFEQWFNESWTSGLAQDTLNRRSPKQDECAQRNLEAAPHGISTVRVASKHA